MRGHENSTTESGLEDRPLNKEDKQTDLPVSIYGATKIANEAMAQSYYSFYKKPIIGLRFFKVYGPWSRPDTVFFKFVDLIYNDQPIRIHNHGKIKHSSMFAVCLLICLLAWLYWIVMFVLKRVTNIDKNSRKTI